MPGIKTIGVGGAVKTSIQIEAFIASIFGLILGPYLGALAAFMGAFIAWLLPPGSPTLTSLVFLPAPVVNALVVGLIYTRRWKLAFVILAILVASFWFLPLTQPWDQYFTVGLMAMWDKIVALVLIIPAAILLERIVKKTPEDFGKVMKKRGIDVVPLLSIVAALFILANAWMIASEGGRISVQYNLFGTIVKFKFGMKEFAPFFISYGYLWLSLGVGMLICAFLFYLKPERRLLWSALIFLLSSISAVIGGGFIVGLFLGVLSGILGALRKRVILPRITSMEMLLYFLLAYIGNEADNAIGNDIFAIPLVYERIFGILSLDILRWAFTIAPLFYFTIRLFQAIITTLIATPLIRNLKAAGLIETQKT